MVSLQAMQADLDCRRKGKSANHFVSEKSGFASTFEYLRVLPNIPGYFSGI